MNLRSVISAPRSCTMLVVLMLLSLGFGHSVHGQSVNGQSSNHGSGRPETTAASSTREASATALREEALAAMDADDEDLAFDLARRAMRIAPDDPQVVFLMALLLGDRHRFPEAIKMLDELAEKMPATRLPVLGQTAEWMVKFGWWDRAEARYRILLEEAPNSSLVHRNLASLFLRQGRRLEAAVHLRKLCLLGDVQETELRPLLLLAHPFAGDTEKETFEPIGDLGIARSEIAIGDWDAARQRLESSESDDPQVAGLLGRIYVHLGDQAAIKRWAESVNEAAEESADYWFAIGSYHALRDSHQDAVIAFCETVLRDQTDAEAYLGLSQSLQEIAATGEAETAKQRAELIRQTQEIGSEMASSNTREYNQVTTLIELLEKLQRPMEALSWRGVRLAYRRSNGVLSDVEAQRILGQLMDDRKQQMERNELEASRQFLLCGVDLESFKRQEP